MLESHCTICLETITDPVCTYCYIKQVRMWFNDLQINPIFKRFAINKIKNRLLIDGINETGCILCGSDNVDVCFYCFGFIAIEVLRELNLTDNMIESFSDSFNYKLMGRELNLNKLNIREDDENELGTTRL